MLLMTGNNKSLTREAGAYGYSQSDSRTTIHLHSQDGAHSSLLHGHAAPTFASYMAQCCPTSDHHTNNFFYCVVSREKKIEVGLGR